MPPQLKKKAQEGLNERRLAVVEKAFKKFDRDGSGVIDLEDLKSVYDCSRHPRVVDGSMSQSMVKEMFLNQFEPCAATRDGKVTWDEFLTYYTKLSKEIDLGRELNHDAYFELVVTRAWKLDEDEKPKLAKTKIVPNTLEKPSGLLATRNMDLVWPSSEDSDEITGFKAVVKPVFARADLPEDLRGFFAWADETQRHPHKYIAPQAALASNYDVIWELEPDTNVWTGFKGIVSSNVDLKQLPADLRQHITEPRRSAELGVHYLDYDLPQNPHYKKSSEAYGFRATEHCQQLLALKKAVFTGDAKGGVFAGRTGKFSNDFGGGMYRNSGLNVTTRPNNTMFKS